MIEIEVRGQILPQIALICTDYYLRNP
jgi:hypothetical protein